MNKKTKREKFQQKRCSANGKNGKMLLLYVLVFKLDFCIIKLDFVAVIKLLFLHSSALPTLQFCDVFSGW